jgi:hypothetical protein
MARVHQLIALVVEDHGAAQPALLKQTDRRKDQAGLSRPQEAADKYNPWPLQS